MKLSEALALSESERYLLLSIVVCEQDKSMQALERALGTYWSVDDLTSTSTGERGQLPKNIRLPLLPFVAPEAFKHLVEDYKKRKPATTATGMIEVANLSVAEAKAFFKSLG
jgi:hypothetical protein